MQVKITRRDNCALLRIAETHGIVTVPMQAGVQGNSSFSAVLDGGQNGAALLQESPAVYFQLNIQLTAWQSSTFTP